MLLDISERKRQEERVAFLAYHDELTGLPSRSMFEELLSLSIDRAQRHDGSVAVVCLDLDDFALVNDSLGHHHGDELLRMVADRLRESTRETDLVARRGSDQFLLLLADMEREERGDMDAAMIRAEAVVQHIHESLTSPFVVASTELYISASMGISLFPQDGSDSGGLLRNAEAAMYESKKSGPAGYVVSARGAVDSSAKLQFVTKLRKAVEHRRWVLHYQPVIELASGQMTGVEALIRWIEPDGTMIPPGGVHPAGRGARADRDDRGLGGERGRLSIPCVDGPGHRPRDRVQPVAAAVLAARPGREDPRRRSAAAASTRPRSSSR